MNQPSPRSAPLVAARTLGALALLQVALPANLAITGVAMVSGLFSPRNPTMGAGSAAPRTILVSGGKMTKSLQLCRSFHAAGHRVVLVEQAKYRLTGHRFSRAVDAFHVVPAPSDPSYAEALLEIVLRESIDLYLPVCSPVASWYDADAARLLSAHCEVLHCDADQVAMLDDKHRFAETAAALELDVPDTHRVTASEDVAGFDFAGARAPYVLKSIPYDPVHRLDLTPLPRPTPAETQAFADSKPLAADFPWILQEFVTGQEYCTHSTVRDGVVQVFCCCESSPFQVNYEDVDKPEIEAWVRSFCAELGLTGQVSFDFIESADGRALAIECNPRTHSAITMFYDHPDLARAYLEDGVETIRPLPTSRPTYWLYHELWRLLARPRDAADRVRVLTRGKDAIFDRHDPLPFLLVHHLQIPALLLHSLWRGKDWIRIDFNIGKLVEAAGD